MLPHFDPFASALKLFDILQTCTPCNSLQVCFLQNFLAFIVPEKNSHICARFHPYFRYNKTDFAHSRT